MSESANPDAQLRPLARDFLDGAKGLDRRSARLELFRSNEVIAKSLPVEPPDTVGLAGGWTGGPFPQIRKKSLDLRKKCDEPLRAIVCRS